MLYGMASAGTVAWVMYQKFCNGLPYYRQEKDWKQYGVEITRATMSNWVIRNSEAFFSSYVRILPQETSGTWIRDGR